MKKIYLISLIVALLCGFLVFSYVNSTETRIASLAEEKSIKMTGVVVANQDIPPFTKISSDMVSIKRFPADYVPENAAKEVADVVNKMANGTIVSGEILMQNALGDMNQVGSSLSTDIPDGKRAITIDVFNSSGVAGYIEKGDFVDLMFFITTSDKDQKDHITVDGKTKIELGGSAVKIISENLEVLRIGDISYSQGTVYNSITVAADPQECEKIYAAMMNGDIYFTLRQKNDNSESGLKGSTFTNLVGE